MYANKLIAILAATVITTAGLLGITHYSNAAASAQTRMMHASVVAAITTLPTIEVRPTVEQIRSLGVIQKH